MARRMGARERVAVSYAEDGVSDDSAGAVVQRANKKQAKEQAKEEEGAGRPLRARAPTRPSYRWGGRHRRGAEDLAEAAQHPGPQLDLDPKTGMPEARA
jgi:hypothetical protein